jgi:hypothetical protein
MARPALFVAGAEAFFESSIDPRSAWIRSHHAVPILSMMKLDAGVAVGHKTDNFSHPLKLFLSLLILEEDF